MGTRGIGARLGAGLTCLVLLTGCATGASPAPTDAPPVAVATPSAPATSTPTAIATPAPTPTFVIGQPADDGARIIAVETTDARTRDLTIDSPAVGTVHVRLLLPGRFDAQPATRWPVLYLLHGVGGTYLDWTAYSRVAALSASTDVLVVMPDAGSGVGPGWYSDWWNGGSGGPPMWETFHLVELSQLLERNWQAGDRRAIAGLSMGGYGAMEYAARRPGMFGAAASYSGVLDPLGDPAWRRLDGPLWGDPVAQADIWKAHDPTTNAAALRGTALYVAYGNGLAGPLDSPPVDDQSMSIERQLATESEAFLRRLADLGIPATVDAYGPGTHTWPYWSRDLDRSFPWLLQALGG